MKFAFRLKWLADGQETTEGHRKEWGGGGMLQLCLPSTHTHTPCPLDNTALPHALHMPTHTHTLIEQQTPMKSVQIWCCSTVSSVLLLTGSRMQHLPHPFLPFSSHHTPAIFFCIVQRQRSYEEEVGSVLNLRLNHIKTALCNFLNNLTRAAPTETDRALCPNIEPCPPNGRESRHFISPHAMMALYCWANVIIALNNLLLGASKMGCVFCHSHRICI